MSTPAWNLLEKAFTAQTLMTPAQDLLQWRRGVDEKQTIWNVACKDGFDVVPIQENGSINGVLLSKTGEELPLEPAWLVSHDTSVPDLLHCFIRAKKPALLLYQRQEVIGLVSPADFNKIAARSYFYSLIGELEMLLARYLPAHNLASPAQIDLVRPKRRNIAKSLEKNNLQVDVIELLDLQELLKLLVNDQTAYAALGFERSDEVDAFISDINDFRIRTMHLVKPVLGDVKKDLPKLDARIKYIDQLIQYLNGKADL